jgi:hypothetical protein
MMAICLFASSPLIIAEASPTLVDASAMQKRGYAEKQKRGQQKRGADSLLIKTLQPRYSVI